MVDSPVGTIIDIGPRGFAILAMFSHPIRLGVTEPRERALASRYVLATAMTEPFSRVRPTRMIHPWFDRRAR